MKNSSPLAGETYQTLLTKPFSQPYILRKINERTNEQATRPRPPGSAGGGGGVKKKRKKRRPLPLFVGTGQ